MNISRNSGPDELMMLIQVDLDEGFLQVLDSDFSNAVLGLAISSDGSDMSCYISQAE